MADNITKTVDGQALISYFKTIEDKRVLGRVKFPLVEVIIFTMCAVLSSANKWEEIVIFCQENIEWFKGFLPVDHGIPSISTFTRIFSQICPNKFLAAYSQWAMAQIGTCEDKHIAIDGKTVRGSHNHNKSMKALHLINAYAVSEKLLLDCEKTPDKSNEIKGIPILLKRMEIAGALVSIDAMGTQHGIANLIKLKKADYCLALKANHKRFYKRVKNLFDRANSLDFNAMVYREKVTTDIAHSRYEIRQYRVLPLMYLPDAKEQWQGLQTFIEVERTRYIGDKKIVSKHYYISSLPLNEHERINNAIRNHWGIENSLHYKLDVSFQEDNSRIHSPNVVTNFSTIRKLALACIERTKSTATSIAIQLWKNAMNINQLETGIAF